MCRQILAAGDVWDAITILLCRSYFLFFSKDFAYKQTLTCNGTGRTSLKSFLNTFYMKKISFILFGLLCLASVSMAQLKVKATCPAFEVDILDGKVNGLKANVVAGEIKNKFPCFTSVTNDSAKCGEAVYYKDKGITFYTGRDYVEITEGFKGKLSIPLLGSPRGSLFKVLGNPKLKDDTWDAYQTNYGCLVLHFNKANKVRLIQFSTFGTDKLNLCE